MATAQGTKFFFSSKKILTVLINIESALPYLSSIELGYTLINMINFFNKNTSGFFQDPTCDGHLTSIARFINKNLSDGDLLMIAKEVSLNENLVNELISNYQFCSFGNQVFSMVMLL
jgi:hypothetical protein